ncbi:lysoplasmalogenase [Streptomyces polyrhachis]|uniref:Lysoplasmalogenase n=1 Tax=Streptomyces polyrhachis TaxID=1282885 RepID=A0ABW2GG07_9ACTN
MKFRSLPTHPLPARPARLGAPRLGADRGQAVVGRVAWADIAPRPPVLLRAFAAAGAVHLLALLLDLHWLDLLTKPLLMPLLAAWAAARRAPRALIAALLCGWAGDVLLQGGATVPFLAGMAAFAAGHVCYLLLFRPWLSRLRFSPPRLLLTDPAPRIALGYAVAWAALLVALWPGLDAGLRVPVGAYSLLLAAMACCAGALGRVAGAGGALFLLSDTLIAGDLAGWPQPPAASFWVMLTYIGGQFLLVEGVLRAQHTLHQPRGAATS